MAAKKKKSGRSRSRRGRYNTDLPRSDTRDPGQPGTIGCYVVFFSVLAIALAIAALEFFG